jgi:hypothetical protein
MERNKFADLGIERPEEEIEVREFFDKFVISVDNGAVYFWNGWIILLEIFGSFAYFYFAAFRFTLIGIDESA